MAIQQLRINVQIIRVHMNLININSGPLHLISVNGVHYQYLATSLGLNYSSFPC